MKAKTTLQEILLITTTTFSQRLCFNTEDKKSQSYLSPIEILEDACWNGLLDEVLPELIEEPVSSKRLYLWNIRSGKTFLQVERSEFPTVVEKVFSINPDFFMRSISFN